RSADIHVGVVSDVFVSAQVADDAQIVFVGGLEHIAGVTTEALPGELQKPVPGSGNNVLDRDSGIVNAVFTTYKILIDQRTVYPGQHVIVQGVDLAEGGAHLARLCYKTFRQRSESDETLFQVDAFFAKGDEE